MKQQEFAIELDGIIGTIHTYTRNPFMMGYTKELRRAMNDNDRDTMIIVLDKIITWYKEEIEAIKNDTYVFNKSMHEKAFELLKAYQETIYS